MTDLIEVVLAFSVLGFFALLTGGIIVWAIFYLTRWR